MKRNNEELKIISLAVREHIIRMAQNGGCFIGASLSCADIIVYLYNNYLNINPGNIKDPARDYFFLSKGHDVPALYGVLAESGFIEKSRLDNHLKTSDDIYWHPNRNIPGIEFHSGSLGHLLSVASGVALDCKRRKQDNKVVVLLGDGELNEGSIWECALFDAAYKLDNLIAIVDRNKFQANIRTEDLIPIEPIEDKFRSFGWTTYTVNGHDFTELDKTFNELNMHDQKPSVIIADTVRGYGLPSIMERADRWFCNFNREEIENLLKELRTGIKSDLKSETLIVR
jgi:transketolase